MRAVPPPSSPQRRRRLRVLLPLCGFAFVQVRPHGVRRRGRRGCSFSFFLRFGTRHLCSPRCAALPRFAQAPRCGALLLPRRRRAAPKRAAHATEAMPS